MPAKSIKAADKQTILKKLVTEMKKRYGGAIPKQSRSAFETLLFAACLEDTDYETAENSFSQLLDGFFDLNEIRVSSVGEIQQTLGEIRAANWKAMRIRESLQFVFEKHYAFDLEGLKRKTQEQAQKDLAQIPHQTSFIRNYVLQHALGAHVIPVDETIRHLLIWLGLADAKTDAEAAAEELKSGIKKTEAPLLCYLLKLTAIDPELIEHFEEAATSKEEVDPMTASTRLAELFKNPKKKRKPVKAAPPAKPAPAAKPTATASKASTATKAVSLKKPKKTAPSRPANAKVAASANRKVTKKVPAKKATRNRSK